MVLRRVSAAIALLGIVAALSLSASGGPSFVRARQVLPTPKGQLGGPMPLATNTGPAAQEAIPTPQPADACNRDPVSTADLLAAAAATPAPLPELDWSAAPDADEALAAAAGNVVTELIACANRNDPARAFALYSADGLARALQRQGITPQTVELVLASAGGALPPSAQARLISLDRVLGGEDRLRAEFTLLERSGLGELRLQSYVVDIVPDGDGWLIDDINPAR